MADFDLLYKAAIDASEALRGAAEYAKAQREVEAAAKGAAGSVARAGQAAAQSSAKSSQSVVDSWRKLGQSLTTPVAQVGGLGPAFNQASGAAKSLAGSAAGVASIIGVVGTSVVALGAVLAPTFERARQFEGLSRGFENLAGGVGQASTMMEQMAATTGGTLSSMDSMRLANQAMLLGVAKTGDEMAELTRIAKALGTTMGLDMRTALESLTTGIGRQSKLFLDNLGILIDVEAENEAYARSVGKSAAALTDAERKQVFLSAALREGGELAERTGASVSTNAEQWEVFKNRADDAKNVLASMAVETLGPVLSGLNALLDPISRIATGFGEIRGNALDAALGLADFARQEAGGFKGTGIGRLMDVGEERGRLEGELRELEERRARQEMGVARLEAALGGRQSVQLDTQKRALQDITDEIARTEKNVVALTAQYDRMREALKGVTAAQRAEGGAAAGGGTGGPTADESAALQRKQEFINAEQAFRREQQVDALVRAQNSKALLAMYESETLSATEYWGAIGKIRESERAREQEAARRAGAEQQRVEELVGLSAKQVSGNERLLEIAGDLYEKDAERLAALQGYLSKTDSLAESLRAAVVRESISKEDADRVLAPLLASATGIMKQASMLAAQAGAEMGPEIAPWKRDDFVGPPAWQDLSGQEQADAEARMAVLGQEFSQKQELALLDQERFDLQLMIAEQGVATLEQDLQLIDLKWQEAEALGKVTQAEAELYASREKRLRQAEQDRNRVQLGKQAYEVFSGALTQTAGAFVQMAISGELSGKKLLQATLQSISQMAQVKMIEQLAAGFGAYPDAAGMASHFKSAALWGVVAIGAGAAAGSVGGGGGGGGGEGRDGGGGGASASRIGPAAEPAAQLPPATHVTITGPVIGGTRDALARGVMESIERAQAAAGYRQSTPRNDGP